MEIKGDIKAWTDGDKACARLYADGPEGPVILHASAPLVPIRRRVAEVFADRGHAVSGSDPAYVATVRQMGKRRAMGRLRQMAPQVFAPGALGPFLARRDLAARRARLRALVEAGQPVGLKPIGPIAAAPPAPVAPVAPPPAPSAVRMRRKRKRPRRAAGQPIALGPASPAGLATPNGARRASETTVPGSATEEGAASDESSLASLERPPEEGDEEIEPEMDEEMEDEAMGYSYIPPSFTPPPHPRLAAAMSLLKAARRHPRARARVRRIVVLAGEGHPKAKKALVALKTAKQVQVAKASAQRTAQEMAAVKKTGAPAPRPAAPAVALRKQSSSWVHALNIFATWRRGAG